MNIVAKTICVIAVATFCAVGLFASPVETEEANIADRFGEEMELAQCEPASSDVLRTPELAESAP